MKRRRKAQVKVGGESKAKLQNYFLLLGFSFWFGLEVFLFKNGIQIFFLSPLHRDPHENRCCSSARIADISAALPPPPHQPLWCLIHPPGTNVERVEQVLVTRLHQRRDAMSATHGGKTPSANSHSPKKRVFPQGGKVQESPGHLAGREGKATSLGFSELVTQIWPWPLSVRT